MKSPPVIYREVTIQDAKNQIRSGAEFSATSATGGAQKKNYWTPDGRREILIPQMHQFTRKDKDGNVTGTEMHDINLEKGYLIHPPSDSEIKPFCKYCGWHNTNEEVVACAKMNEKLAKQRENSPEVRQARLEAQQSIQVLNKDNEIEKLRNEVEELKKLIKEKLGG